MIDASKKKKGPGCVHELSKKKKEYTFYVFFKL